jgi:hypothetical protein
MAECGACCCGKLDQACHGHLAVPGGGQLEVLHWLVYGKSPPCPWDPTKCMKAAEYASDRGVGHAAAVFSWIEHVMGWR